MTYSIETSRMNEETSSLLTQSREWTVPVLGQTLKRDEMLQRFDAIALANAQVQGTLDDDFAQAYEASTQFVHTAFDHFEKRTEVDRFDWTFAVPARGEQSQGEEYASEVTFFLPLLDPRFGVNAMIRQRTVAHLAPAIIETYKGNEEGQRGALVWTPAYFDPSAKRGQAFIDNVANAQYRINEAAGFVRHTLGANVMGLGAVMPVLTKFGSTIHQEGLLTTTGHGGTVHLVGETVREVVEKRDEPARLGILGLGSIGNSSLEMLRGNAAQLEPRSFVIYDKDPNRMNRALFASKDVPTLTARNELDLLRTSDIIVTAVTGVIDLDKLENGHRIDLTGKTIIDDSQPGCFDRAQVEARGGKLIWVVGEDTSQQQAFKRVNSYSFGDESGLYGSAAVWGCEAEAGSIAMNEAYEHVVNTRVTPEIARKVGKICYDAGIRVSKPMQSYGQPVDI